MSKRKRGRTAKPQASFKVRPKTARSGEHNRLRACGIFDAIFVPATKGPAQTLMYPISSDRKLLLGRRLSPRCIPLLSINARHAPGFVKHLADFF